MQTYKRNVCARIDADVLMLDEEDHLTVSNGGTSIDLDNERGGKTSVRVDVAWEDPIELHLPTGRTIVIEFGGDNRLHIHAACQNLDAEIQSRKQLQDELGEHTVIENAEIIVLTANND